MKNSIVAIETLNQHKQEFKYFRLNILKIFKQRRFNVRSMPIAGSLHQIFALVRFLTSSKTDGGEIEIKKVVKITFQKNHNLNLNDFNDFFTLLPGCCKSSSQKKIPDNFYEELLESLRFILS